MAPWSFLSGSASEAEAELPAHMEPDADKKNRTAFSIFIDGALTTIYNEASGRSKDQKALRAGLKNVLGESTEPRSHARNTPPSTSQLMLLRHDFSRKIIDLFADMVGDIYNACFGREKVTHVEHHQTHIGPAVQEAITL